MKVTSYIVLNKDRIAFKNLSDKEKQFYSFKLNKQALKALGYKVIESNKRDDL